MNNEFLDLFSEPPPPPPLPALQAVRPSLLQNNDINPWPPQLVFDLALGLEPTSSILTRHGLDDLEFEVLLRNPTFRQELAQQAKEVAINGQTFKNKARMQAEEYLQEVHDIVTDLNVPPSTRLDAIKSVVRWGGLEPKEEKTSALPQNAFQININLT